MINLKKDEGLRKLGVFINDIPEKVAAQAFRHSANRAATSGKTIASRRIAEEIKLKQKPIRDRIVVVSARSAKAALSAITAIIGFVRKPVPLIEYGARQTKSGVAVSVKGARKTVRHAFIAQLKSGHRGVFMRREVLGGGRQRRIPITLQSGLRSNKSMPIQQLYSTTVSDAMENPPVNTAVRAGVMESLRRNLAHDIPYYLKQAIERAKAK